MRRVLLQAQLLQTMLLQTMLLQAMLLLAGLGGASAEAAPVSLLSHRAAYRLSLAGTPAGASMESVMGGLVIEWRADCTGWLSQQRLGFVSQAGSQPDSTYDARSSSWESTDYQELRFAVRNYDDGKVSQAFNGTATAPHGGAGRVEYSEPAGETGSLPEGTLFPTEHIVRLIEAAQAGQRFIKAYVFDGSGPEGLNEVSAVIGSPATGEGGERSWRMNLAYFDVGTADQTPQFSLAFDLGERGVMRNLVLDYGDFALKADLEKLEPLDAPACK